MPYSQQLSSSAVAVISNAQMIGGITTAGPAGRFNGLPAFNSTSLPVGTESSVLRSEMSGSQSVIHALNKLAATIDSSNDLTFGDGTSTGTVALGSQTFLLNGTSNEVETDASGQTLTIGLPDDVTIGGTLTATTAVVPAAAGGATLGSAALEFGGLFLGDDDDIAFGADQDYKLKFRSSDGAMVFQNAIDDAGFSMFMMADAGADAGDEYSMNVANGGTFTLKHDKAIAGTQAATLTITPGATAATDVAEFSGIVKVGSNIIANSEGTTTITMDTDEDITVAGDVAIGGGVLTFSADATIVDQGGHTRIEFTDTGNLLLNDPAGGLEMTVADGLVTVAGDLTVSGNDIDFAAGAGSIGGSMGANIFKIGSLTGQNIFGSADGVVEGVSIGLKAATAASSAGGAGNAKFMSPVTGSKVPGVASSGKLDAAIAVSSSLDIIGGLTAAGQINDASAAGLFNKMVPFLSIQGADATGIIKDYKLQVSGGILQVTEYQKVGNAYS
jgi:hypothetical protein